MLDLYVNYPTRDRTDDVVLHARITVAVGAVLRNADPDAIVTAQAGSYKNETVLFSEPPYTRSVTRETIGSSPMSRIEVWRDSDGPRIWLEANNKGRMVLFHNTLNAWSLEEAVDDLERFAQRVAVWGAEQ